MIRLFPNPKYLYCRFNSIILVLRHYGVACFPYEQSFRLEWWAFSICQPRSSSQYHHWIYWRFLSFDARWSSFAAKSLRSSMNKRCEIIISPWRLILYPMLLVFYNQESGSSDRIKSNPDGLSPWKMPVLTEKWSVLIWPSWWLRCNDVFQYFTVFLRKVVVNGWNLWIFRVSIIQSWGKEPNAFFSLSTLLIYSVVLVWRYPSPFCW